MKIEKYLLNKDIKLSNDDIDIDSLTSDLRRGYVEEKTVSEQVESAVSEKAKENTKAYTELETKYNDLEQRNADLTSKNEELALERDMASLNFKADDFKTVTQIRKSVFQEIKDNKEALQQIKTKFSGTFFPETEVKEKEKETPSVPNEAQIGTSNSKPKPITITRKTRCSDLFITK